VIWCGRSTHRHSDGDLLRGAPAAATTRNCSADSKRRGPAALVISHPQSVVRAAATYAEWPGESRPEACRSTAPASQNFSAEGSSVGSNRLHERLGSRPRSIWRRGWRNGRRGIGMRGGLNQAAEKRPICWTHLRWVPRACALVAAYQKYASSGNGYPSKNGCAAFASGPF